MKMGQAWWNTDITASIGPWRAGTMALFFRLLSLTPRMHTINVQTLPFSVWITDFGGRTQERELVEYILWTGFHLTWYLECKKKNHRTIKLDEILKYAMSYFIDKETKDSGILLHLVGAGEAIVRDLELTSLSLNPASDYSISFEDLGTTISFFLGLIIPI